MTPEQQRLAIANVCKVKALYSYALPARTLHCDVPDYLSDLNAMHEAEKMLTSERDCERYRENLNIILRGRAGDPFKGISGYLFHATALQRAEAFLKTLNLWTGK